MNNNIRNLLYRSVILSVAIAVTTGPAHGVSLVSGSDTLASGFTDFSTWNLLGSATASNFTPGNGFTYSDLVLTSAGSGNQAGAGFAPGSVLMNFNRTFTFASSFFVAPGSVAQGDGMTFVITGNDPLSQPVLGNAGSDLGYGGSAPGSFAFAIDTFNFTGEPASPSIQILQDGSVTPLAFTETGLADIRDPSYYQWWGTLSYTPSGNDDETGTLTGTIDQYVGGLSFSVSTNVDWSGVGTAEYDTNTGQYLGRRVYYGFTAGNGLADDGHFVTSATAVVPVPAAAWLFGSGMLGLVGAARNKTRRTV